MIHLVDQALEKYLRATVPLPETAVDVSFAAPDKTWGKARTRPSINLFLWDLKRSAPRAQAGTMQRTNGDKVERRPPLPVMDLNYYVTAWASDESDEHQLLGSVMATFLATHELPRDYLFPPFDQVAPITVDVATSKERKPGDYVSILDGQLKPGLEVRVTVEIDALAWQEAGPPTERFELGVSRTNGTPPESDGDSGLPALRRTRKGESVVMEPATEPDEEPAVP